LKRNLRFVLISGVLLLCVSPSSQAATPTFVQGATTQGTANLTLTLAYGSNPAKNDLLIVWVSQNAAGATSAISDTIANTWTAAATAQTCGSSTACTGQLFYAVNKSTAADTITLTVGISSTSGLYIVEYSGMAVVSPLDTATNGVGVSTPVSSPNITATTTGELIIAAMANELNAGLKSVAGPYTARESNSGASTQGQGILADWVNNSTSVTGASFTSAFAGDNEAMITAAFKQGSGGSVLR
jgi:hypothetical protein